MSFSITVTASEAGLLNLLRPAKRAIETDDRIEEFSITLGRVPLFGAGEDPEVKWEIILSDGDAQTEAEAIKIAEEFRRLFTKEVGEKLASSITVKVSRR
jgi:hypothetical protein